MPLFYLHVQCICYDLLAGGVSSCPATVCPAGAGAVVRDLFKSHFSSLQQVVRGAKGAREASEDDDCLTVQQDRQSFSAKYVGHHGQAGTGLADGLTELLTNVQALEIPPANCQRINDLTWI